MTDTRRDEPSAARPAAPCPACASARDVYAATCERLAERIRDLEDALANARAKEGP